VRVISAAARVIVVRQRRRMLTYAHVCWRMLAYADVCRRMLTYVAAALADTNY
jgi:hypothetical protein